MGMDAKLYSSSLLLFYEGGRKEDDDSKHTDAINKSPLEYPRACLVDFAHSVWTPGSKVPTDYVEGLQNAESMLMRIPD